MMMMNVVVVSERERKNNPWTDTRGAESRGAFVVHVFCMRPRRVFFYTHTPCHLSGGPYLKMPLCFAPRFWGRLKPLRANPALLLAHTRVFVLICVCNFLLFSTPKRKHRQHLIFVLCFVWPTKPCVAPRQHPPPSRLALARCVCVQHAARPSRARGLCTCFVFISCRVLRERSHHHRENHNRRNISEVFLASVAKKNFESLLFDDQRNAPSCHPGGNSFFFRAFNPPGVRTHKHVPPPLALLPHPPLLSHDCSRARAPCPAPCFFVRASALPANSKTRALTTTRLAGWYWAACDSMHARPD